MSHLIERKKPSPASPRRHRQPWADALEARCLLSAVSFSAPAAIPTSTHPAAIVSADFNKDGNMDLAVADQAADQIDIYLGDGTGAFSAGQVISVPGTPVSLATGDFDGNGFPDLVVGCSPTATDSSTSVTLFLNTNGTFGAGQTTDVTSDAAPNEPLPLAVGDFNLDGNLDVATANYTDNSVSVLFGTGTGTFAAPVTFPVGYSPTSILAGDFGGDGTLDLAVADNDFTSNAPTTSNVVSIFSGTGSTTTPFNQQNTIEVNDGGDTQLAAGQLTSSGKRDLIVTGNLNVAQVFQNQGAFQFSAGANIVLPQPASSVTVADFNGDGNADLLFTTPGGITVASGAGDGTFPTVSNFSGDSIPIAATVADFNNDAKPDVATIGQVAADNSVDSEASYDLNIFLNNTADVVVNSTTVTLTSSQATSPQAQPVQFTATVATTDGAIPTGNVDFYDGLSLLGTQALADGSNQATFTAIDLAVGSHQIYAQYDGDANDSAGTSNSLTQTVTPVTSTGPDLTAELVTTTLPTTCVPGEAASAKIQITNDGSSIAHGAISNGLYLSLDGTLDSGDIPLSIRGPLSHSPVNLKPDQSEVLSGAVTIPSSTPAGTYQLLADVNNTGSLVEANTSNNVVAAAGTITTADDFGTVAGRANVVLNLPQPDGSLASYKLTGPGIGSLTIGDSGTDLSLTGITPATSVSISALGGGDVPLHNISADGVMAAFKGAVVDLSGSASLPGAGRVQLNNLSPGSSLAIGSATATVSLGSISGASVTAAGGINALSIAAAAPGYLVGDGRIARQWMSADISAPWIGSLLSRGPVVSDLTLSGTASPGGVALKSAAIAGKLGAGNWSIGASVNSIVSGGVSTGFDATVSGSIHSLATLGDFDGSLSASSIGSVLVRGSVNNASILAGVQTNTVEGISAASINSVRIVGNLSGSTIAAGLNVADGVFPLDGDDTLITGGSIHSVLIQGQVQSGTHILASSLPTRARVHGQYVACSTSALFQI